MFSKLFLFLLILLSNFYGEYLASRIQNTKLTLKSPLFSDFGSKFQRLNPLITMRFS